MATVRSPMRRAPPVTFQQSVPTSSPWRPGARRTARIPALARA